VRGVADAASIIIAAFIVVVFVVLFPISLIVGTVRRWFWSGLVATAWARVEQAKNRKLRAQQSGDRAREAYVVLRDALMEDASKSGHGDWTYKRREVLTCIAQSAASLEDEPPELKPNVDEILAHARENSFYDVGSARKWLAPIADRVNR
jgi:hypothetical protein